MPAPPLPRLASIDRSQLLLHTLDVERLIDEDHSARSIWHLVGRMNLSLYHAKIAALEGRAGRDHTAPQLLISLWLYAYLNAAIKVNGAFSVLVVTERLQRQRLQGGLLVREHRSYLAFGPAMDTLVSPAFFPVVQIRLRLFQTLEALAVRVYASGRCEKSDFAKISSEPKCMPKVQRSLIRHPGAIFFKAEIAPRF